MVNLWLLCQATQIRARDFFLNDKGIAELVPVFCTYELIICLNAMKMLKLRFLQKTQLLENSRLHGK